MDHAYQPASKQCAKSPRSHKFPRRAVCTVLVLCCGCEASGLFFLLLAQTTKNRVFQHNKSASWREGDSHVQQALSTEAETPAAAVAVDMFCFGDLSLGERSIGCACSVSATSKDRSVVLAAVFRPLICWKQIL